MAMKRLALSLVVFSLALSCASASAALVDATYSWTGAKGWSASGSIRYDESIMYPAAAGPAWGAFSTGIDYFDLSIYDSTGALKGAWVEILNSVAQYNTLRITLDTSAAVDVLASGSKLDLGITTDSTRPDYWGGTVGSGKTLVIAWNRVIADSGPGVLTFTAVADPTPTPTPATAALLLLGLGLAAGFRGRYAGA